MKKLVLFAAIGMMAFVTNAQIQNYSVGQTVSDFTVTDTKGNTHNLYTYTAAGKHVFLDFFFVTCGPCQQTNPIWNEFYDKYGCNSGDVICISINLGIDNDAQVIAYENTYGGAFSHTPAVSSDGGSTVVNDDFNPQAYPTYCLIGPDNLLKNSDIWPVSSIVSFETSFPAGFNPPPIACTVGIEENANSFSLEVYPNPSGGDVNMNIHNIANTSTIEVINVLGKVVYTSTIERSAFQTIPLNGDVFKKKGIYFVRVSGAETTRSERIIIY